MSSYDLQQPFVLPEANPALPARFPWRRMRLHKALFVIASMMDVVLTLALLQTGAFYESNPIASQIIDNWGYMGMTLYKLVIVFGVLMIANIISIWRVDTSRRLLWFGTAATAVVVVYSSYLIVSYVTAI